MGKRIYKDDSIRSVDARTFTRMRAGVYCGSTEYSTQLLRELYANALDEHNIGNGNKIIVKIDTKNNIYTIIDEAQGFPVGVEREDGETVLQASFDVLNTSGKYDNDGVYGASALGLNGIGGKLTNFLSNYLIVSSANKTGKEEKIWFKDGIFEKREYSTVDKEKHGTIVEYQPDPQFFQHKEANITEIKKLFEDISALCPKLYTELYIDDKFTEFHSANGISDLVDKKVGDKEIIDNRFKARKIQGDNLFDICLTYTSDYSENITSYVNYGLTESGVHLQALRSALTRELNKYANANNLFKKNEENLNGTELSEGLVVVCNLKANGVQYDSQSKVRVVDIDRSLITSTITEDFALWLNNNSKDAKTIIERALSARRAREAAQKARDAARNATTKKNSTLNLPTKLVDAWGKDRKKCELIISEGDSAAGGLIGARDSETQAIFPIRGKIINTFKNTNDKTFANQEVNNIVKALGLALDPKTHKLIYDINKLRYGKIILCCDADPDGFAIKNLLITCLWSLCPELVTNGHVYAAVPPLFRITTSKNEYIFLKGPAELEEYKKKHSKEKYLVNRNKGLGEQDAEELEECLLNPETRNIVQLMVDDLKETEKLLDIFMGPSPALRRDYILQHELKGGE